MGSPGKVPRDTTSKDRAHRSNHETPLFIGDHRGQQAEQSRGLRRLYTSLERCRRLWIPIEATIAELAAHGNRQSGDGDLTPRVGKLRKAIFGNVLP